MTDPAKLKKLNDTIFVELKSLKAQEASSRPFIETYLMALGEGELQVRDLLNKMEQASLDFKQGKITKEKTAEKFTAVLPQLAQAFILGVDLQQPGIKVPTNVNNALESFLLQQSNPDRLSKLLDACEEAQRLVKFNFGPYFDTMNNARQFIEEVKLPKLTPEQVKGQISTKVSSGSTSLRGQVMDILNYIREHREELKQYVQKINKLEEYDLQAKYLDRLGKLENSCTLWLDDKIDEATFQKMLVETRDTAGKLLVLSVRNSDMPDLLKAYVNTSLDMPIDNLAWTGLMHVYNKLTPAKSELGTDWEPLAGLMTILTESRVQSKAPGNESRRK